MDNINWDAMLEQADENNELNPYNDDGGWLGREQRKQQLEQERADDDEE